MIASKNEFTKVSKCCKVFTSNEVLIDTYPMKSQDELETTLHWFCKEVGLPVDIILDRLSSQTKTSVKRIYD